MRSNREEISFLVFSDDWGEHPSSCQHLFRRISRQYKVLWVNTIGMRDLKLSLIDLKKAVAKFRKMLRRYPNGTRNALSGTEVDVCQPPMLPFSQLAGVRLLNRASVVRSVRARLAGLDMIDPILVTTVPNACDCIGNFGESKVIYYCVDDFSEWPGMEKKMVKEMEDELIGKSDSLVATSQKLFDRLSKSGKPTHLLTHGVDLEFFQQSIAREHKLLDAIPRPRVGYYGLFDERSDHDLLAELARRMPDVSFVITGLVESDRLRRLRIPNIHFTGNVPYTDLPAMVRGWDVLILPYVRNDLTDAISPLKLKEYLASGKPVVSTPIPEVLKLKEYVCIAETAGEWEKSLRTCLDRPENGKQKPGEDFWANESWDNKADNFMELCQVVQ